MASDSEGEEGHQDHPGHHPGLHHHLDALQRPGGHRRRGTRAHPQRSVDGGQLAALRQQRPQPLLLRFLQPDLQEDLLQPPALPLPPAAVKLAAALAPSSWVAAG